MVQKQGDRQGQDPRWIEYLPVSELPDDDRNPKTHAETDLDASLDRFGYTEPVLIDERTGLLASGHGRKARLVARQDGGGSPPDGVIVGDDGVWRVPVVRGWASVDDTEAAAYLIAANQLTTKGGWNHGTLSEMLAELKEKASLDGVGFRSVEVDDLRAALGPPPSLKDLAAKYGPPDPSALWPVLRFKIPLELKERFSKLVVEVEATDEAQFRAIIELAEREP